MYARDCGYCANRNPAAHEVRDDETSPPGQGARLPPIGSLRVCQLVPLFCGEFPDGDENCMR